MAEYERTIEVRSEEDIASIVRQISTSLNTPDERCFVTIVINNDIQRNI